MFLRPSCRSRYPHRPAYKAFCPSVGEAPCGRPPFRSRFVPSCRARCPHRAAGTDSETLKEISPPAGGEFLLRRCKRNQKIAGGIVRKESAAAVPCAFAHDSPGPPFYGGARGVRGQSRPARCPHEGCLTVITAALLNELDRLLLHGTMRLSGAAYTVGGDGRGGPFFVCRGRCPHRPVGGHMGPPLLWRYMRSGKNQYPL